MEIFLIPTTSSSSRLRYETGVNGYRGRSCKQEFSEAKQQLVESKRRIGGNKGRIGENKGTSDIDT